MANTIKIKRGLKANLPSLSDGELAFTTDSKESFIGYGGVNYPISPQTQTSGKKLFTIYGDGTTTDFTFSHNLDTHNVTYEIYDDTTYETVMVCFKRISSNDVQVSFGVVPAAGENYTLIIT